MNVLHLKMKPVKRELKKMNHEEFSNISSRVMEKQIALDGVNCKICGRCIEPHVLTKAAELNEEYKSLCDAEWQLYQNKSRVQWC
ncbi:hypothetical protein LIER_28208 [Lithospermum erythrorhizon]|uniref:Uncharacterized protein n=1 Tax=Lithospermum erythrorhizon TaxID=34254 RepID=A0AAV3RG07_LITER